MFLPENKKLYLDACCFNRPFDDQTQDRIRIEAEAIMILLNQVSNGYIKLIGSDVLKLEIEKTPDPVRKSQVKTLTKYISKFVCNDESVTYRAKEIQEEGFKGFDAFHIASAEKGKVDFLLTTDDKMLKLYIRKKNIIKIKLQNPLVYLQELLIR